MMDTVKYFFIFIVLAFMSGMPLYAWDSIPEYSSNEDCNIEQFYYRLAKKYRDSGPESDNEALMHLAATVGEYQLSELEKANPMIRRITHLDFTLWNNTSEQGPENLGKSGEGVQGEEALSQNISQVKTSANSIKFRANPAARALSFEFKNVYFQSSSRYTLSDQNLELTVSRMVLLILSKLKYNTNDSAIRASAEKTIKSNLYVYVSASRNLETSENFAGFNLKFAF